MIGYSFLIHGAHRWNIPALAGGATFQLKAQFAAYSFSAHRPCYQLYPLIRQALHASNGELPFMLTFAYHCMVRAERALA